MSVGLVHSLAIVRTNRSDAVADRDEYGQPTTTTTSVTTTRGLVQPKSAREVALISQAGDVVSDHTIFLPPVDVIGADYLRFDPDDGRRYEVTGVRDAAGIGHHLEVDARLITAAGS